MSSHPTILPGEDPAPTGLAVVPQMGLATAGATALSAQVQATVAARYMVAMQRPRNWDDVRQRLLAECRRPGFAESAQYRKPIGGGKFVEGESIRFAEAVARNMGNVATDVLVIDEDDEKRVLRVTTTDIESNTSFSNDVMVKKTVERRQIREGQTVISSRRNTNGEIVHLIAASDDELLVKQGNMVSKATRNNLLRLLPGDILDDCMAQCQATLAGKTKEDPDAARKKLLDAFGFFSVLPSQVGEYLGHDPTALTAAELDDLRKVYAAIKTGETSWPKVMQEKAEELAKAAPTAAKTAADKVREKLEK